MSHTPKPWTFIPLINKTYTQDEIDNVICSGKQVIAQINDSYNPVTDGTLMAAAPELLEALQIAKGLLELDLTFREEPIKRKALIAALAAIDKATGEKHE